MMVETIENSKRLRQLKTITIIDWKLTARILHCYFIKIFKGPGTVSRVHIRAKNKLKTVAMSCTNIGPHYILVAILTALILDHVPYSTTFHFGTT